MPLQKGQEDAFARCIKAKRYVMKGGVTARTAIDAFKVTDEEDVRTIRKFAASCDIGKGMPASTAISLNDVENEDDQRKIRMSGALRAVRKGAIAHDAIRTHGVMHGNDRVEILRTGCSKDMEAGLSAFQAARHQRIPTAGYIFRQVALQGAQLDLERGTKATDALERNGVAAESDARKIFRSEASRQKAVYFRNWLAKMRTDQVRQSKTSRKQTQPVDYQPVTAFVDLVAMGASSRISIGEAAPDIVATLKVSEPSHVAEINWRCAKRDFAGENTSGDLVGKKVSALYALRRNAVQDKDHAEYLLRAEVDRITERRLRQWLATRVEGRSVTEDVGVGQKRSADEAIEPEAKIRRMSPSSDETSCVATSSPREFTPRSRERAGSRSG